MRLAQAVLGRAVTEWRVANAANRSRAADILCSALAVGFQIFVMQDRETKDSALCMSRYAAVRPAGIIALVGLAELAHISERF